MIDLCSQRNSKVSIIIINLWAHKESVVDHPPKKPIRKLSLYYCAMTRRRLQTSTVCSALLVKLYSAVCQEAGRARLAAPGTKVIASVTLLQHVTAERQQMYSGGGCTRSSVRGSGTAVKHFCKERDRLRRVGGGLLRAERLSLLARPVHTQWFTVFGSAGSFLTLTKCLCDGGSSI